MSLSKRKDPIAFLLVREVGMGRRLRGQARRAGLFSSLRGWLKSGGYSVEIKGCLLGVDLDGMGLVLQIRRIVAKAAQPGEPPSRLSRSSAPRLMKAVTEIALSFQSHLPNPTHVPSD